MIEDDVWEQVRTAIVELSPHPFIVMVGDWQQLQPVHKGNLLKDTLKDMVSAGTLRHIELQRHQNARSNDPVLLEFLDVIRNTQPTKAVPRQFFGDRWLAPGRSCKDNDDIYEAVQESMRMEADGRNFTFLTITNQGATRLNHTRCLAEFGDRPEMQDAGLNAAQGDPEHGGLVVALEGLRLRLTRNIDKNRNFVNGALNKIVNIVQPRMYIGGTCYGSVFIAENMHTGVLNLVHPVMYDGKIFMPYTYGYAMTMRRAQGSTLDMACLWFNHSFPPDRGYAYVGASRVRNHRDLYLMGKLRRTDWLPVGDGEDRDEQLRRGSESVDTPVDSEMGSDDYGASEKDSDEDDYGASRRSSDSSDDAASAMRSNDDSNGTEDEDAASAKFDSD